MVLGWVVLLLFLMAGQSFWMRSGFWPAGTSGILATRLLLLSAGVFLAVRLWHLAYREKPLERMASAFRELSGFVPELPVPPRSRLAATLHIGLMAMGAALALGWDAFGESPGRIALVFECVGWGAAFSYALRSDWLRRRAAREVLKHGLDDRRSRYRREAPALNLRQPGMGPTLWGGLAALLAWGGQGVWRWQCLEAQQPWSAWGRCLESTGEENLARYRVEGKAPEAESLESCLQTIPAGLSPVAEKAEGGVLMVLAELSGADPFGNGTAGDQFMAWDAATGLRISVREKARASHAVQP